MPTQNQTPLNKNRVGKNIFISYRERDSAGEAGRLVDALKAHFVPDQIFMDIDKIEPGVDFTDAISNSLESCDVMLAIIGPRWQGQTTDVSRSRIREEGDWVRVEIASALARNIRVVPVLVDGAELPTANELPEDLQPLLKRQAYEISHKRWRYDTDQLIAFLQNTVGVIPRKREPAPPPPTPQKSFTLTNTVKWVLWLAGGFFILSILLYALGVGGEEENALKGNPNPVYDSDYVEQPGNNNPVDVNEQDAAPINNVPEIMNVAGSWNDANGLYYLQIAQEGENLSVSSHAPTGNQTGSGSGTIRNNQLNLQIEVYNVGFITLSGTLSSNGQNIRGTTSIQADGSAYSEPLHLTKY